jgi:sucrose-6-phosphate hydrolase SacC (GH32 family)
MSNWQYATKVPTEVWRSAMTLPRELELAKDKTGYYLNQKMIPQYDVLTKTVFEQDKATTPFEKLNIDLSQTEVDFNLEKPTDIILSLSNAKGEVFTITLSENQLVTDRSNSGLKDFSDAFASKPQVMPLHDAITSFQLILDKSSVEILLNHGKYSMTNLFFPTETYTNFSVITKDNSALTNFKIKSISRVWK